MSSSRPCGRGAFLVLAVAGGVCLAPRTAHGWAGREHRAIGIEAYTVACRRLAAKKDRDPQTAMRYQIACANLKVQAFLYGQSNRVGGDFLGDAESFLTTAGASLAVNKKNYLKLALTNSTHFQPAATREWRELHTLAIGHALRASQQQGAEQITAFEEAFYESAMADHFLQDSFAAGHMGFNRPGSSAGASLAFHDEWNKRGRMVSNRRGDVWRTYGDGLLDRSPESLVHVAGATTDSVYAVLSAFVLGERNPASDLAVWEQVAFTIENPELLSNLEELIEHGDHGEHERGEHEPGEHARGGKLQSRQAAEALRPAEGRRELTPLLAVMRPAVKDAIVAAWSEFSTTFEDEGTDAAFLVGGHLAIPFTSTRMKLGVGLGFANDVSDPRFAVDAGFMKDVLLTVDGLISHELDFGALFLFDGDFGVDASLRLAWRMNLEAGNWLLRFELGPSLAVGDNDFGLFGGVGLGWVIDAAGGGTFR